METVVLTLGSDQYAKFKYPAGELQVRLAEDTIAYLATAGQIAVLARITAVDQLVELCLLWDAVRAAALPSASCTLVLPYLPFSRADRRFVPGDCFGLEVFSKIINTLDADIITLDAHSAKSGELIDRLTDVSSFPLIAEAVSRFAAENSADAVTVLFPDEGARKRYALPAAIKGIAVQVVHCSKKRDPATGKFVGFAVPELDAFPKQGGKPCPVLIVDDICDGGGTFIGIADGIKDYGLSLGLYVTHGIFSKGLLQLEERLDLIYTTDSFRDWENAGKLHIIPAISLLIGTRQTATVAS